MDSIFPVYFKHLMGCRHTSTEEQALRDAVLFFFADRLLYNRRLSPYPPAQFRSLRLRGRGYLHRRRVSSPRPGALSRYHRVVLQPDQFFFTEFFL